MKIFEGKIVSISSSNTVVVEITRRTPHPLYRKLIKRSKKYKTDTNGLDLEVGMTVKIAETRPMSKSKYFKVLEVVGKQKSKAQKTVIAKAEEAPKPEVKEEKAKAKELKPKKVRKTVKKASK